MGGSWGALGMECGVGTPWGAETPREGVGLHRRDGVRGSQAGVCPRELCRGGGLRHRGTGGGPVGAAPLGPHRGTGGLQLGLHYRGPIGVLGGSLIGAALLEPHSGIGGEALIGEP